MRHVRDEGDVADRAADDSAIDIASNEIFSRSLDLQNTSKHGVDSTIGSDRNRSSPTLMEDIYQQDMAGKCASEVSKNQGRTISRSDQIRMCQKQTPRELRTQTKGANSLIIFYSCYLAYGIFCDHR